MPFFLILLLLILTEIALFVVVGGRIGLWSVLGLTLLSVLLGLVVLRLQSARAAALARGGLREVSPGTFLAKGAFAALAGLLLLLPGFLTDVTGMALLLPPLQRLLMRAIAARIDTRSPADRDAQRQEAEIIEGSFSVDADMAGSAADEESTNERDPARRRRLQAPHARDPQGRDRGH